MHRSHSNLKNKTNRWSHKEHRTTNDVGNDCGHDSVAPQLHFLFFLLLLSFFSQCPSTHATYLRRNMNEKLSNMGREKYIRNLDKIIMVIIRGEHTLKKKKWDRFSRHKPYQTVKLKR